MGLLFGRGCAKSGLSFAFLAFWFSGAASGQLGLEDAMVAASGQLAGGALAFRLVVPHTYDACVLLLSLLSIGITITIQSSNNSTTYALK